MPEERLIRIDRLVAMFNSRYPIDLNVDVLLRAASKINVKVYKKKSTKPQVGRRGRPANAILLDDVFKLESEIRSRLPVRVGQDTKALKTLTDDGMTLKEIAKRSGIHPTTMSQINLGRRVMTRGELDRIKQIIQGD